MKYILSIIFVFISLLTYSQQDTVFVSYNVADYDKPVSYKIDTVLFASELARHILVGTTVLPSTSRQQYAKNYGLYLQNITSEPCKNGEYREGLSSEIISVTETENELHVSTKIIDNCCYSFLCEMEVINEKTINLITHGYGSHCACECCFGVTFHFHIEKKYSECTKLESIIINGQEGTCRKIR